MKRFFTIICAVAAIAASAACSKFSEAENVAEVSEGKLVPVTLRAELPASVSVETRDLTAYTDMLDYEKAINSIQYLVYEVKSVGVTTCFPQPLFYYKATSLSDTPTFILRDDKYYMIYAYANIEQDLSSLEWSSSNNSELYYTITGNEKTTGFPMAGRIGVDKPSSPGKIFPTSVSITLKHKMSRVAVGYIKNNLPAALGDLKIRGMFLMNVPSMLSMGDWYDSISFPGVFSYNVFGRSATSEQFPDRTETSNEYYSHIIDGSTYLPLLPDLTYKALDITITNGDTHTFTTPDVLYTAPNPDADYPFNVYNPALVLMAEIQGTIQYYLISFVNKEMGTDTYSSIYPGRSATIGINISGYGSTDPIVKAAATVSTSVNISSIGNWDGTTVECS